MQAYDRAVEERDGSGVASWKHSERERFLQRLQAEGKSRLVDIGSGPGTHAAYFQKQGINVTCIDLAAGNVSRCKEKGLEAFVCDVMDLASLGKEFDCAFAMNSLLHIPRRALAAALLEIRHALIPGGLFFWGQYGGEESEGVYQEDHYDPKRFFSLLEDKQIIAEASAVFELEGFLSVELEDEGDLHFQSLILRPGY